MVCLKYQDTSKKKVRQHLHLLDEILREWMMDLNQQTNALERLELNANPRHETLDSHSMIYFDKHFRESYIGELLKLQFATNFCSDLGSPKSLI